jgi:hypothetical protein
MSKEVVYMRFSPLQNAMDFKRTDDKSVFLLLIKVLHFNKFFT